MIKINTSTSSGSLKKLKSEKREEKKKKIKTKQASLSDQLKRMAVNKDYTGDAKKFVKNKTQMNTN